MARQGKQATGLVPAAVEATVTTGSAATVPASRPRVIAIANFKGGVGKTTTTVSLGAVLAEQGRRVLLIDLDPGGTLTKNLAVPIDDEDADVPSIYQLLRRDARATLADVVYQTPFGLDVVPANRLLALIPYTIREDPEWGRILARALGPSVPYDFVLIDCPPEGEVYTYLALGAATDVLVVLQPEGGAIWGLDMINRCVARMRGVNPGLSDQRFVVTMVSQRTALGRDTIAALRREFGARVCETVIRRTIKLAEAMTAQTPISRYEPNGEAAESYRRLAAELFAEQTTDGGDE